MADRRLSSEEAVRRGQVLYEQNIRDHVEAEHRGKMLVVDIDTGDYEIDSDAIAALDRAKSRHPDASLYVVRIGYPTAVSLGGYRNNSGLRS
jgi:hypothetical protein